MDANSLSVAPTGAFAIGSLGISALPSWPVYASASFVGSDAWCVSRSLFSNPQAVADRSQLVCHWADAWFPIDRADGDLGRPFLNDGEFKYAVRATPVLRETDGRICRFFVDEARGAVLIDETLVRAFRLDQGGLIVHEFDSKNIWGRAHGGRIAVRCEPTAEVIRAFHDLLKVTGA